MERRILTFVCLAAFASFGCSISNSSESLSDSVSSPFEWSSDSSNSSSQDDDSAYRQDVSDYTVAFSRAGDDLHAFRAGVRALAESRGLSDWEQDGPTCASIGRGLRHAGLDPSEAMDFAYALLNEDGVGLVALQRGYESLQ